MKVVMAIDDSGFSDHVLQAIVTQFRPETTELLVLYVLQPLSAAAPPQMAAHYAPELNDQRQQAQSLVEQVSQELRGKEFAVRGSVEVGDVRERIIDTADEWHADLIIVGSHGKRSVQRFLLGSVAESVACGLSRRCTGRIGTADRRSVTEATMGADEVVVAQPGQERVIALLGVVPVARVSPLP
jgi:nucleotide-binding universal stress UspA family protein